MDDCTKLARTGPIQNGVVGKVPLWAWFWKAPIVESGWNVWVWLVGVVSRRWVWLVGEDGIYGCGCKGVYRFPHTTYPSSSCMFFFGSSIPTFCSFKKCFSFLLFQYFFVIKFYVLNNFFAQNKHTYGRLRASHSSYMKAAHNVLFTKKHVQTYVSYPAMDISCITSRSMVWISK